METKGQTFWKWKRESQEGGREERRKRARMSRPCPAHVPTPPNEHDPHILQPYTNKK